MPIYLILEYVLPMEYEWIHGNKENQMKWKRNLHSTWGWISEESSKKQMRKKTKAQILSNNPFRSASNRFGVDELGMKNNVSVNWKSSLFDLILWFRDESHLIGYLKNESSRSETSMFRQNFSSVLPMTVSFNIPLVKFFFYQRILWAHVNETNVSRPKKI